MEIDDDAVDATDHELLALALGRISVLERSVKGLWNFGFMLAIVSIILGLTMIFLVIRLIP
jgi:hypothetical protein